MKIIHLLSGGLDSTVLLYDLVGEGHHVTPLIFNYGQKHEREIQFAIEHSKRLRLLPTLLHVPHLLGSTLTDGDGTFVVPNRNAVFISIAVNMAVATGADRVTIGCNKDDAHEFLDCRFAFMIAINAATRAAGILVEIDAPYVNKSKAWIARRGSDIGVSLSETWSCYEGGDEPCGKCLACQKRKEAI